MSTSKGAASMASRTAEVARARKAAPATKVTVKKAPAKQTAAAKKAPAAKAPAKKAPAAKAPAKKAPAAKAPAKKAPAAKAPAAKAPAKKAVAKKAPARRALVTKAAVAKKTPTKPAPVAKKAPATKAATKTAVTKPAATKTAASKAAATKVARAGRLAVRGDESPWTEKELGEVRAELEADRDRLQAEISLAEHDLADLLRDSGDGAGDDQADAGAKTFEREQEISVANNSREMLVQTERALRRIEDSTYGVCEICGNPIGKMRLQAFPRATLCVADKQRQERH
jgi:RNA polymerase-binding transcription factor DksA